MKYNLKCTQKNNNLNIKSTTTICLCVYQATFPYLSLSSPCYTTSRTQGKCLSAKIMEKSSQ